MGSWNGTCMLSHLPIEYNEPVVAYVLDFRKFRSATKLSYTGIHDTTDYATPIIAGVRGLYDDYGSMWNFDINSIRIKVLSDILKVAPEEIFKTVERGNADGPYGLVMIHEHIHDNLVSFVLDNKDSYYTNFDSIKTAFEAVSNKSLGIEIRLDLFRELSPLNDTGTKAGKDTYFKFWLETKNDDIIKDLVDGYNELAAINLALLKLRKFWITMGGLGSQGTYFGTNSYFHKLVGEQINKSLLKYADEPRVIYNEMLGKYK